MPWHGMVYRIHNRACAGDSALGSRKGSGRYNVGLNSFPRKDADGYEPVRTAEEVSVALTSALDCRTALRMSAHDRDAYLFGYSDSETGQSIASHALKRGCDGLLIPSATGVPGFNIIPFVAKTGAGAVTLSAMVNLHLVADVARSSPRTEAP